MPAHPITALLSGDFDLPLSTEKKRHCRCFCYRTTADPDRGSDKPGSMMDLLMNRYAGCCRMLKKPFRCGLSGMLFPDRTSASAHSIQRLPEWMRCGNFQEYCTACHEERRDDNQIMLRVLLAIRGASQAMSSTGLSSWRQHVGTILLSRLSCAMRRKL